MIREMTRAELDVAVDWAAAEGWNPGPYDADCFYAADPGGFLIGLVADRPAACISGVRYGSDFAFVGFYIVRPDLRGRGYGWRIWRAMMERLTGRTLGLDGVVDQQPNYRRSGFVFAHRNVRHEGTTGGKASIDAIVDLADLPFAEVQAYDRAFFPADRESFLSAWLDQPERVALGLKPDEALEGFGVIRGCRSGYKIGPLYGDSPDGAERLFQALCARVEPGQPVYLDTPEPNREAVALAERHGMQPVFETARMYTESAPELPLDRWFGVTSFELG